MDVVDFYPKTFKEIPKQDNPAFGDQGCLMLVKENKPGSVMVTVLLVCPEEKRDGDTVTNIAMFWRHSVAMSFCENYDHQALANKLLEEVQHG